jgi:ketosteroid isomerase-like protein
VSQQNVEVVRRAWQHFVGTHQLAEELAAPDLVWDMSSFRGWPEQPYYEGVEGMYAFLRDWFEPFDDLEFVVEGYHEAGDDVVTVVRQHGRARSSGVRVEMRYAVVTTVRDGLLARAKVYSEPREALSAVGLAEDSIGIP